MAGIDEGRLVQQFLDLVRIYSPSLQEGAVAAVLEQEMNALGLQVQNDRTGPGGVGNLVGLMQGDGRGIPIFLSAHMDTVEPSQGITAVVNGGVIRSDGTTILGADCKASIAAILEAVRVVRDEGLPHGDLELLFTYSEERGLEGANALDPSRLRSRLGFIADSSNPPGTLVVAAPSQDKISAVFRGRAAHAGMEPEKGIDALAAAAKALSRMTLGRIDEETTANFGLIRGGLGRNVVPDRVELEGEARSRNNEKLEKQTQSMVEAMKAAAAEVGATVDLDVQRQYEAYRLDAGAPVVRMAWQAAEDAGLRPELKASGGATDANILNARGFSAVVLGTGMTQPHSLEEHITVADMVGLTRHLLALIQRAATGGELNKG